MKHKMSYLSIAALLAVSCAVLICQPGGERSDYAPRAVTTVRSTQLAETKIVPTLNTPLGKSGNAVWCATFQVAWNRAKDKVIGCVFVINQPPTPTLSCARPGGARGVENPALL
ncbi:MAG TPA: hypothetical protein PLR25_14030 [Planctomycetaceae bacterium]|nr:hypothetical protein [Planctomycetaceae bacterium]